MPRGAKGAATTGAWAVTDEATGLDDLDVRLLEVLRQHPRLGMVEVARRLQVARATAQARLQRLVERGVVSGFGPDVDLVAAGYPVAAFSTLEIAQGALQEVTAYLEAIPAVLEASATTGGADVWCRLAAASMAELQETLLQLNRCPAVVRSTSVVAMSELVPYRYLPLLQSRTRRRSSRLRAADRGEA